MRKHDLRCRLFGIILLAAAAGSTMLHREAFEAARHGPAQTAEFAFALLTMMLASAGLLLLLHGARLLAPTRRTAIGRGYDTKAGVATAQARRAIDQARARLHADSGAAERSPGRVTVRAGDDACR